MTTASEEVPAEEGPGSADLLAALRAVARRLRQAGGTLHLSDHTFDLPVVLALGQPSGRPPCGGVPCRERRMSRRHRKGRHRGRTGARHRPRVDGRGLLGPVLKATCSEWPGRSWLGRTGRSCRSGGDDPVLLEPVEAAFDDVAAALDELVEPGWPATGRATAGAVGLLVASFGDDRADPGATQIGPVGLGAVAPVGQHPVRAGGRMVERPGPGRRHAAPAMTCSNMVVRYLADQCAGRVGVGSATEVRAGAAADAG
jgi:hypothetical protein